MEFVMSPYEVVVVGGPQNLLSAAGMKVLILDER